MKTVPVLAVQCVPEVHKEKKTF
jgi:hypothetical protein